MDEIQELYAECQRLRDELRKLKEEMTAYVDNEIRHHERLQH